jgi:hypothetical protein
MEGPLERLHMSSRSVYKHGRHRQFLFLISSLLCISNVIFYGTRSELESDCCSGIFQLYHAENKLIFNKMMMRSALY